MSTLRALVMLLVFSIGLLAGAVGASATGNAPCPSRASVSSCPDPAYAAYRSGKILPEKSGCAIQALTPDAIGIDISRAHTALVFESSATLLRQLYPDEPGDPPKPLAHS